MDPELAKKNVRLGWLLFASCILVVLMAEFGWGKALRPHEKRR